MHLFAEVEELPGLLLRVARVKVGKQLGFSQVPEARAVVRHGVGWAWDVVMHVVPSTGGGAGAGLPEGVGRQRVQWW